MTTKILALADALGNLSDFRLLPGHAHDLRGTAALIDGGTCGQFLGPPGVRCELAARCADRGGD